jgi:3,5-epimerase/4-reductase
VRLFRELTSYILQLTRNYPNALLLRVRMPISDDLSSRSFVTKITKYAKVVNVPNSMTVC